MSEQILMTPEEMRTNAKTIDGYREQIESLLSSLDGTIGVVEAGWRGASQNSFLERYHDMKTQALDQFPGILEGISTQLTTSAQVMEDTDTQLSQMLRGEG